MSIVKVLLIRIILTVPRIGESRLWRERSGTINPQGGTTKKLQGTFNTGGGEDMALLVQLSAKCKMDYFGVIKNIIIGYKTT
jgi:hypothetical protein